MTDIERFMSKVEPVTESGCWLWTGPLTSKGYARVHINKIGVQLHRVFYEFYRGPIPNGFVTDYLCRVRCCLNPYHLEIVTNKTNVLRGVGVTAINAQKTHCPFGHSYTPDNLVKRGNTNPTYRNCRTCHNLREKIRSREKRLSNG